MPEGTASEEICIIVQKPEGEMICVRKNGHIEYYKMVKLGWAGHVDLLGANKITK